MKIFSNITKRLTIKEPKKILGRWNIETCKKRVDRKVDYSNEDHCGPCGLTTVASPVAAPLSAGLSSTGLPSAVSNKYPIIIYK
jgi:hypothetical protein